MVRLKSTTQACPNGFYFYESATDWHSDKNNEVSKWDFKLLCTDIQAMRRANPRFNLSTDLNMIALEASQQNALRMLSIPGADIYIIDDRDTPQLAKKSMRPLNKGLAA